MTKDFALGDILSITTGRLVSRRHMEGVYAVLNWMTRDDLMTHQLPRASRECEPWLLRQHPQLGAIVVPETLTPETWLPWLEQQEATYGTTLPVELIPMDDHTRRDPIEELREMAGGKPVIVIDARHD